MSGGWRRRVGIGFAAGVASGAILLGTWDDGLPVLVLAVGGLVGVAFALAFHPAPSAVLDALTAGAAFAIPGWAIVAVIAVPILAGDGPRWEAAELRALLPALIGWVLFGAALGVVTRLLADLAARLLPVSPMAAAPVGPGAVTLPPTRVLILGGGFGGVETATQLERALGADPSVAITLVSETNALLFTPMLAEAASGSLEAAHISAPLRTTLRRTRVVRGRVTGVDLEPRRVALALVHGEAAPEEPFDHLVIALGAVSNFLGRDDLRDNALDFKTLADAARIRNRVIEAFERADREADPDVRRALVTFVVAGGGFAGAELAGGLNDFARGMLPSYPGVPPDDVAIVLVHSRERILPELGDELAAYALARMRARGVTFRLGARVVGAGPGTVRIEPGGEIRTETFVWTAGTRPNPLLETLPVARDKRGAVVVEPTLAVPGRSGVWAVGDCASVPNAASDGPSPPTAQFALRQAKTVARNVVAAIRGRPTEAFRFKEIGLLCVVGHQTACAEIRGRRFSGFFAWLLWRGIYLAKLPGLERKAHVLGDWVIELFFPRDIVQTVDLDRDRE